MVGKEGIYNRDAVYRIRHIQKLEKSIELFNEFIGLTEKVYNKIEEQKKKKRTLFKAQRILKNHHSKVLHSPTYLKDLMEDLKL